MTRAHCDRCDSLIEPYVGWIEDDQPSTISKVVGQPTNAIWHIEVTSGGVSTNRDRTFCRNCMVEILESYLIVFYVHDNFLSNVLRTVAELDFTEGLEQPAAVQIEAMPPTNVTVLPATIA